MIRFYLFVAGTMVLLGMVGLGTYWSGQILRSIRLDFNLLLHPAQIAIYLALGSLCIGLGFLSGLPAEHLGWASRDWLLDSGIGIALGLALPLMINPLVMVAVARWGPDIFSPVVMRALLPRRRREWALLPAALLPVILAEELLFRSLLVGGLGNLISPWLWAAGGALLFGIMHAPQGRLGILVTAAIGMIFSIVFILRGSLVPALIAHYLTDLIQVIYASRHKEWLEMYPSPPMLHG